MELFFDAAVSVVGVIVIGQHGWAGKAHFASERMPPGAILIAVAALATGLLFLFLTWAWQQPPIAAAGGLALQLLSLLLFRLAIAASRSAKLKLAFDEANPHGLVTEGPYRYVRHPFYASYLLFWIGWAVALWHPVVMVPLAVIAAIYVRAAVMEEQKFARTPLAASYAEYRMRTGFLWPRLSALTPRTTS